jgi:hypothetical protein
MGRRIIARGLGLGLAAMLLIVAIAFAWVFFYSVAIAPGHDGAFYQAYAQRVAPLSGIIAGIPIFLLPGGSRARPGRPASRFDPRRRVHPARSAPADRQRAVAAMWLLALSYITKAAAAFAGGRLVKRQRLLQ